MFRKLKHRLVAMYGITTSIVVFVILIILFYTSQVQNRNYRLTSFEQSVNAIVQKLQSGESISSLWMAQMLDENHIFIYLEEDGKQYDQVMNQELIRDYEDEIDRVKELALIDGLNLMNPLIRNKVQRTDTYELKKASHLKYYATAAIIPVQDNCISLVLIEWNSNQYNKLIEQIILYLVIAIVGAATLFGISRLYIGKVLKPLEEGQKKQVQFVAAASHELRSPMTVIQVGIATISKEPEQMDHFIPYIQGECKRMNHLIEDMLILATADAKSWSMNQEKIEMDTFLIEIYDMFCCMQQERGSQIALEIGEEELLPVYGDRERLKQVLTILIDNGWNYTSKEQGISLKAYNKKHQVVIEVIDHGPGIPDEDKEKVFERFFRGDSSRTDKKHYGLGLSIAKEIIALHGGIIEVADTVGGGATFRITLNGMM